MEETIFTKIIKGEAPSHKIYEDGNTYAFLNIYPKQPGHVLVVPKRQVEFVWDLEDEQYEALMQTVKKVALRLRKVMGKPYVGEQIVGVDVPHAHVHLFPFADSAEFHQAADTSIEPNHNELAKIAQKLQF